MPIGDFPECDILRRSCAGIREVFLGVGNGIRVTKIVGKLPALWALVLFLLVSSMAAAFSCLADDNAGNADGSGKNSGALLGMPDIRLSPFELDDSSGLSSIKLVETKQGVLLLLSRTAESGDNFSNYVTTILSVSISDSGKPASILFKIPQLLPPPPDWDAVPLSDNCCSLVFQRAGGAADNILATDANDPSRQTQVGPDYPFDSYSDPRFMVGCNHDPSRFVSAVVNKERLALFERVRDEGYSKIADLGPCIGGMIFEYLDEFFVFYKTDKPGPAMGDGIAPGNLNFARLGKDFSPAGPSSELFPSRTAYEFQMDASAERIAVFATSKEGTFLASGFSATGPFEIFELRGEFSGEAFSSPAVLVGKKRIHVALLKHARTKKATVLTGTLKLPPFGK